MSHCTIAVAACDAAGAYTLFFLDTLKCMDVPKHNVMVQSIFLYNRHCIESVLLNVVCEFYDILDQYIKWLLKCIMD